MNIYKKLPNIITFSRLVLTLFIIIFGLLKHYNIGLVFCILASLTDFLDGFFARKFKASSNFGAKLDAVVDKVFVISLLITLIHFNKAFLVLLILEVIIAISNLYYYFTLFKTKSLLVGKIKTWSLFLTIIIAYINIFFKISLLNNILNGFLLMTGNLQFLSLLAYFEFFIKNINKKEIDNTTSLKLEKTIYVDNLDDLLNTGEEVI